jgi:flagellar basal-body rod protein FlgB
MMITNHLVSGASIAYVVAMLNPIAGKLERYMDLLNARQKLVASNIANADTPGYRTRDLDFQSELQNAPSSSPHLVEVNGLQVKNDGNNVSIDREARLLAENALRFQMASNLLRGQVRAVRAAIQEGKS